MELKREDKTIGSSLEAHIDIYLKNEDKILLKDIDISEIAITSSANIIFESQKDIGFSIKEILGVKVDVMKAEGEKCLRCWKFEKNLNKDSICPRCEDVIKKR